MLLVPAAILPFTACAQSAEQSANEVIVYGREIDLIGTATSGSEGVVGFEDFEHRPLLRVAELAENVPGLIATQHSGGGKANQYFLRGFNLDHGTDLAGFVDGAPVNLRTHGHGQGYLNLNFLIPEMIERIDYAKGPYRADEGDFASAGSLAFTTKSRLAAPIAEVTAGSWGYRRALAAGSEDVGGGTLLGAIEGTASNGPWILDEDLRKLNALVKYTSGDVAFALTGYHNRWTATDQVPERAIESGQIPRLGFIDPNLGGRSTRIGLTIAGGSGATRFGAYAIGSWFRLTSNFTYFLENPVVGDEFRQVDRRGVFGGHVVRAIDGMIGDMTTIWGFGASARYDLIGKVGLYRSVAGRATDTIRQDRVNEYSGALFGEAAMSPASGMRLILGLRGDAIGYDVRADLPANSGRGSAAILTPKAAFAWQVADGVELYANYGEGYHSNDVRGAVIAIDPVSGDRVDRVPVFARSRGVELGTRVERGRFTASLVGFGLDLASELVFVGDAGTTEPNEATRRYGFELASFWRPTDRVTLDASVATTHARFHGVASGEDHIPNAVPTAVAGGASLIPAPGITLTMRLRHFGAAPLIEDGTQRSDSTTLVNAGAYLERGRFALSADVLNLFDAKSADITYFMLRG